MIVYAITNPSTLDFNTLKDDLERFYSMATMIVYRDKDSNNYEENAGVFMAEAKGFERVLLHSDYLLASTLHADGVHLKSTQLDDIKKAKDLGLFVVVSTHTKDEAKLAETYGADMITFSPIFDTPNKGRAVGVDKLKDIVSSVSIPVIALGGIVTQEHINSCMKVGAKGFASIRYFERNLLSSL
jgi:thiamine-phosphate pyrophosphorylase